MGRAVLCCACAYAYSYACALCLCLLQSSEHLQADNGQAEEDSAHGSQDALHCRQGGQGELSPPLLYLLSVSLLTTTARYISISIKLKLTTQLSCGHISLGSFWN